MSRCQQGSSLIEYCLYATLVIFLLNMSMYFGLTFYRTVRNQQQNEQDILLYVTIRDALCRDISAASCRITNWFFTKKGARAWKINEHCCSWILINDSLYRQYGLYDQTKDTWLSSHCSLLAKRVVSFAVKPLYNSHNEVTSVEIALVLDPDAPRHYTWTQPLIEGTMQ